MTSIKSRTESIRIEDFDYPLPDERIARHPLVRRDACKLLVSRCPEETLHAKFSDVASLLPEGNLVVCNDTRVINARISFHKSSGARIEVFLLDPMAPEDYVLMFQQRGSCRWRCLVGNSKKWKEGELVKEIEVDEVPVRLRARRVGDAGGKSQEIEFSWDGDVTFASVVEAAGNIPIPPYLKRESEKSDLDDYQTVYAEVKGSVAAPTAGLHFTPEVFAAMRGRGMDIRRVTLHVGAGTFQPVKSDTIGDHPMHTEAISVERDVIEALRAAIAEGRGITAIGTTSVRTLESLPYLGRHAVEGDGQLAVSQWEAYDYADMDVDTLRVQTIEWLDALLRLLDERGENTITAHTSIMIAPGFRWRVVDSMVTNFHQPQSTLLLLVSSFLGNDAEGNPRWRPLYDTALAGDYRFLSYGDACLFFKGKEG